MHTIRPLVFVLAVLGTTVCGGCGGSDGDTVPGGATVTGTVVNESGQPVPVVPVIVAGHDPVLTDASGRFRVERVSVPYTLILIEELGQQARVFAGLTRLDPTLQVDVDIKPQGATLSGTTSGGVGFPLPPNYASGYAFGTVASGQVDVQGVNPANGDWDIPTLRWQGPLSTTVRFFALQFHTDGAGLVDDFTGLASLEVPIRDGETRSGFEFALGSVSTAMVSGAVNVPPGYTLGSKQVWLLYANGLVIPLPPDSGPLNTFSLATVDAPDVSTILSVSPTTPTGGGLVLVRTVAAVPASGLTLDVPPETALVSPASGATGVSHETTFTVSPNPGRLNTFEWVPQGPGPEIELLTTEPSVKIPDLSEYGLFLPRGATYEWRVQAQGPDVTVDDMAGRQQTGPLPFTEGFFAFAVPRTFTTAD